MLGYRGWVGYVGVRAEGEGRRLGESATYNFQRFRMSAGEKRRGNTCFWVIDMKGCADAKADQGQCTARAAFDDLRHYRDTSNLLRSTFGRAT